MTKTSGSRPSNRPMLAENADGGAPYWPCLAWPIDIPNGQHQLRCPREVTELNWKGNPFVPAARKGKIPVSVTENAEGVHGVSSSHSLPSVGEGFVRCTGGQGQRSTIRIHLTGDIEVRASLLAGTGELQQRVIDEVLVARSLSLPF